jgi:hypothetical protein
LTGSRPTVLQDTANTGTADEARRGEARRPDETKPQHETQMRLEG